LAVKKNRNRQQTISIGRKEQALTNGEAEKKSGSKVMMRAMALLKKGKVYIQIYSKATSGVWIAQAPSMLPASTRSYKSDSMYVEALMHSELSADDIGEKLFAAFHVASLPQSRCASDMVWKRR
jgi:hypothetical protein